jgi:hypothetical protein
VQSTETFVEKQLKYCFEGAAHRDIKKYNNLMSRCAAPLSRFDVIFYKYHGALHLLF